MSSGVDTVLLQLRQALSIVHSPASSIPDRAGAQGFCDEVKTRPDSAALAVEVFCGCDQSEIQVRHFALSCLESFIATRWTNQPQKVRDGLKSRLLHMVLSHTRSVLEEALFIKEKLAVRVKGGHQPA